MSTEKKIFAQTVYTAGHDLSKRWFIRIKIPDFNRGRLSWKKCYGDINKFDTVEARMSAIDKLIAEIEAGQEYNTVRGSRRVGYVSNEHHVTSVVHQFKKQLAARSHRLRLSSQRRYTGLIKNLESWLFKTGRPHLPVGLLTSADANCFFGWLINDDHQSAESHNQHLRLFKSFYTELILEGITRKNPFVGIKGMDRQNVPALYFSNEQIATLKAKISFLDPQLWLFINFIYYAFIRPGELRQLQVGDINFVDGRIRMRPEISKNKKLQYVSIPDQMLQTLLIKKVDRCPKDFYVFGKNGVPGAIPLSVNAMKIRHQKILKGLKFSTNHKLYSWKHTGAIACARAGMSMKDLQMQLRHHSLDQVDKYLRSMLVWESDFIKHQYPTI